MAETVTCVSPLLPQGALHRPSSCMWASACCTRAWQALWCPLWSPWRLAAALLRSRHTSMASTSAACLRCAHALMQGSTSDQKCFLLRRTCIEGACFKPACFAALSTPCGCVCVGHITCPRAVMCDCLLRSAFSSSCWLCAMCQNVLPPGAGMRGCMPNVANSQ